MYKFTFKLNNKKLTNIKTLLGLIFQTIKSQLLQIVFINSL